MRPLPQVIAENFGRTRVAYLALLTAGAWTQGCGGGGAVAPPPPPPPSIIVSVAPSSGSVVLGNQLTLTVIVSNTTDTSVSWAVNGIAGGNSTVGTISSTGIYTAPADLPSPATVQITATSHADPTESATSNVTVASDITLSLTPSPASVELGATQRFQVTITSRGHPDPTVGWSLSGAVCPSACGTVDSSGTFTAPGILPSSASVTLTAQSVADPSKQISAAVTITSNFALQLSTPSSVPAGTSATIVATLTPQPNSNPSTVVAWSLSGAGCSGSSCGVLSVTTTQSTGGSSTTDSATYTAPGTAPTPNTVTVTVTPQADPSKKVQATIAIQPGISLSVSPLTATLAANHRVTLAVQVSGTSNSTVNWNVNGIPGGNGILGQICVTGSNPCQVVASTTASTVDYLAPGSIPWPNPVSATAVSAADSTKSASAQITVINHVLVSVQPANVTLSPLGVQGFQAAVLGTTNQTVTWQVQGTGCSTAGACGTVNANGIFTAPASPPSPNAIQVVAISADDTTQSGAATVTISGGPNILSLHPSSVYAGATQGFTLRVDGSGFAASSPGPGSTLLIAGAARTTSCISAQECTAPVTATDVAIAGSVSIQVQNPNGAASASVSLIIATPNPSDEVITLTSSSPSATGKDIVVVDPTTAGISSPGDDLDLNVAALGTFSITTSSCSLGGNPVPLQRPASGTATADICLFSQSGFDTSMTYTVSGSGDVAVISKQPAGLGIIHLTLQIPATAAPGARTLFIQTTNLDKTAASGALEVQ